MTITPENTPENPQNQAKDAVTQQNIPNIQEVKGEEKQEDPNWKAFREARKKDRQEKEAAQRRAAEKEAEADALKAAMEAAFAKSSPQSYSANYDGYENQDTEDQRIEKKVSEVLALHERNAEQERQQREAQEYPHRLQQIYSDFNQTVSTEALDYLEYHYPEVANPLKRLTDGFDKWNDIYKAVKKFVPNIDQARKDASRAEANFNKPKSMSSPGTSQTNEGLGGSMLTEERKAANWERMQRARKSSG